MCSTPSQAASGQTAATNTTTATRPKDSSDIDPRVVKLYDEGVAAADAKQWEKARELFQQAFDLDKRPQIAANLGNAEFELGKLKQAAEHFEYFLRNDKDANDVARSQVEQLLQKAQARLVTVTVTVTEDDAEILVNGASVGKSPLPQRIFLDPGGCTFEAKKDGWDSIPQTLDLAADTSVGVKLTLIVKANDKGPGTGTPAAAPQKWRLPLTIAAGGLAAVGLGVGIGLMESAKPYDKAANDLLAQRTNITPETRYVCGPTGWQSNAEACATILDNRRKHDARINAGISSHIVAGVAIAGMVTLLLLPKPKATAVKVVPTVGRQNGLWVTGSF